MRNYLFVILLATLLFSCVSYQAEEQSKQTTKIKDEEPKIELTKTVTIPSDGSSPIAGYTEAEKPDAIITFSKVGEKFSVATGQTVNFIYDGIDPESTFIIYESTLDGYNLQLAYKTDKIAINFKKLCQIYVVASPALTSIFVPENLRYEQIVWTPRQDGTWEVRIGTTERGCKSDALKNLDKLRKRDYEKNIPR